LEATGMNVLKIVTFSLLAIIAAWEDIFFNNGYMVNGSIEYLPIQAKIFCWFGLVGIALLVIFDKRVEKWRNPGEGK
jgi:hypothetical protein